jgi:hypothetical protein
MNVVHAWEDLMSVLFFEGQTRRHSAANGNVVAFPGCRRMAHPINRRRSRLRSAEAWRVGLGAAAMVACGWTVAEVAASLLATATVAMDHSGALACVLFRMGCMP